MPEVKRQSKQQLACGGFRAGRGALLCLMLVACLPQRQSVVGAVQAPATAQPAPATAHRMVSLPAAAGVALPARMSPVPRGAAVAPAAVPAETTRSTHTHDAPDVPAQRSTAIPGDTPADSYTTQAATAGEIRMPAPLAVGMSAAVPSATPPRRGAMAGWLVLLVVAALATAWYVKVRTDARHAVHRRAAVRLREAAADTVRPTLALRPAAACGRQVETPVGASPPDPAPGTLADEAPGGEAIALQVPAAVVRPALMAEGWMLRWCLCDGDLEIWDYWMMQPPVVFDAGGAWPDPLPAPPAEADVPAPAPVPAAEPPHAPVAPVAPAAPALTLQEQIQQVLDTVVGSGGLSVQLMPGSDLPQLPASCALLPPATVQAIGEALDICAPRHAAGWMQVQLVLASGFAPVLGPPQQRYQEAMTRTRAGDPSGGVASATHWQALQLRLRLAWLQRSGKAACLLGLAQLRQDHAALSARAELPVLLAWHEVLLCWADLQQGSAALARLDEAEAVCAQVMAWPGAAQLGQQRLADTLRRRAQHDRGGLRDALLRRAAAIADAALAEQPSAVLSLTAANIALAHAQLLPPAQAAERFDQALAHTVDAASEPALQPDVLQCRLAIQLAWEALAGGAAVSPVAMGLADRLHALPALAPETWRRILELQLRGGNAEQACLLAAQAARQQPLTAELIALWERASSAWQALRPQGAQRLAWQDNVRIRLATSLSY